MADTVTLSDEEIRRVIHVVLEELGLNTGTGEARAQVRSDLAFLRTWRQAADSARSTAWKAVVGLIASGFAGWLWMAFGPHK